MQQQICQESEFFRFLELGGDGEQSTVAAARADRRLPFTVLPPPFWSSEQPPFCSWCTPFSEIGGWRRAIPERIAITENLILIIILSAGPL